QPRDRGDANDTARCSAADHRHRQRLQDVVETIQVGAHDLVPVLVGQRGEGAVTGQPGVAYHPVVSAVGVHVAFQDGPAGGAVGDVELQHPRLLAQPPDFAGDGLCLGTTAAAVQNQVEACAGQAQGDGSADAPARTGDQD